MQRWVLLAGVAIIWGCHTGAPTTVTGRAVPESRYLFVWAGDSDKQESDFLAVIDVDRRSPTYAQVITTLPVGATATMPHHTEYQMPASDELWANGFAAGRTFRFDLHDPTRPRLAGAFDEAGGFRHPHSFARLANGHLLGTFQHRAGDDQAAGGLVELDTAGRALRAVSAATSGEEPTVRPYSIAVVPALDRVITTATDMHLEARSRAVQIWRLSDLTLLHTLLLPPGPRGDENQLTAEPRVLADGHTVMVNTFTCGLYLLRGLDGGTPSAEPVRSSPYAEGKFCAVPVVAGHFWLQPSGVEHAVVSLDVADPSHPREAGRLELGPEEVPHWLALEPSGRRLVITGYRELATWVLLADLDPATGTVTLDTTFKARGAARPGLFFGRAVWPHGGTGAAIPHGAVFARP
jgi:56kDa selenium binding protein (SBP56)